MARRKQASTGAAPGAAHPRSIFSAADVSMIMSLCAEGWSQREIAERMTEVLVERGARAKSEPPIRHTTIGKILREERHAED